MKTKDKTIHILKKTCYVYNLTTKYKNMCTFFCKFDILKLIVLKNSNTL